MGVSPDILASAKGIGGGFPLGACLTTEKVAQYMSVGSHGSTYGSNPLSMAVANAVLDVIEEESLLENTQKMGALLKEKLQQLQEQFPDFIMQVKGRGLMLGLALHEQHNNREIVAKLQQNKLLTTATVMGNVIRITPPLTINEDHIDKSFKILEQTFRQIT